MGKQTSHWFNVGGGNVIWAELTVQIILTYFVRESFTVRLTSCSNGLDSAAALFGYIKTTK